MNTQLLTSRPEVRRSSRGAVNPFTGQHRRRLLRADLLTVLFWASLAGAVALWLADGGAAGFSTPAGSFTALGIVAGLAGMDLVLLMLLLAARIPLIDHTVGHDRALEFHRKLGKPALYLLLAHGILIAIGYGMAEGLDPVSEAVALWVLVPDMWLAYISMLLFIAVVVTSLVAVRRRFPYEFWYAVHLLTYAAVLTVAPPPVQCGRPLCRGHLAALVLAGTVHRNRRRPALLPRGPAAGGNVQAPVDRQAGGAGGPRSGEHRDVRPCAWTSWQAAAAGSLSGGSWLPDCGGIRIRSACPPTPSVSTPPARAR